MRRGAYLQRVADMLGQCVELGDGVVARIARAAMSVAVDKVRPLDRLFDPIGHCAFQWP